MNYIKNKDDKIKSEPDNEVIGEVIKILVLGSLALVVIAVLGPPLLLGALFGYLLCCSIFESRDYRIRRFLFVCFSSVILLFTYFDLSRIILIPNYFDYFSWIAKHNTAINEVAYADFTLLFLQTSMWTTLAATSVSFGYFFWSKKFSLKLYTFLRCLVSVPGQIISVPLVGFIAASPFMAVFGILIFILAGALSIKALEPLLDGYLFIIGSYFFILLVYAVGSCISFMFDHDKPEKPFNALDSASSSLTKKNNSNIPVGRRGNGRELFLDEKDLNHHIHVLGQPGSGKSVFLRTIYGHQILNGSGLMMIDLKADLDVMSEIKGCCEHDGRIQDLQIIDLSNPDSSIGYNPLLRGNATEIKDKIMNSIVWSESYYKKTSERFLLAALRGLVTLRDHTGITPTLHELLGVLTSHTAMEELAVKIEPHAPELSDQLIKVAREIKQKDVQKDLSGLITDLDVMLNSEFGSIFINDNSLDFLDSVVNNKVVYILLDGQTYGESAVRLARMLVSELRTVSGFIVSNIEKQERPKFTVIVDEFADIVSTPDLGKMFVGLLNRCRGSGIGIVIAHQSLGDFADPRLCKQVLDSTESLFSFVQKDPESCEILASIGGTQEVWEKTEQTGLTWLGGDDPTGRGTRKKVQEFIFHPNEFKNLNVGEAIYIAKKPARFDRVKMHFYDLPKSSFNIEYPGQINKKLDEKKPVINQKLGGNDVIPKGFEI